MRKVLSIAWKEVYIRFRDRNLILLMIVTPLVLSTIIGLAFSRVGNNDVPVADIPVAVVNLDRGSPDGINYGDILRGVLVAGDTTAEPGPGTVDCDFPGSAPPPDTTDESQSATISELTEAVAFDLGVATALMEEGEIVVPDVPPDSPEFLENAARRAVEEGIYAAAVIIPPEFTENISFNRDVQDGFEQTDVLVYADAGRPISGGIIYSIASEITNEIIAGNIKLAATFEGLAAALPATDGGSTGAMGIEALAACAFQPGIARIQLAVNEVEGVSQENTTLGLFVLFGSAQAMFFGLFTAGFGVLSMYAERRDWTLQRLLVSPTPRSSILLGKLVGVFLVVVFQIGILLAAMTVVASFVIGEPTSIWGTNILRIILVTLSASIAVTGFGMFIAGVARTPEQGQILNSVFAIGFAVLGGSFGFFLPQEVAQFSMIYWGRTAFEILASRGSEIGTPVIILAVQGFIFFLVGLIVFNRRFDAAG